MKIRDGKEIAVIKMVGVNGIEWTEDFFNAGTLEKDEEDCYVVESVQDCIDAAVEYCNHDGDYADISDYETKLYLGGFLYAVAGTRVYVMTEKLSHTGETIQTNTELCHDVDEAMINAENEWDSLCHSDKQRTVISVIIATPSEDGVTSPDYSSIWETIQEWRA